MLVTLLLLCFNVLLAIGVHSTTWWLRKANLNLAALLGALVFIGTLFVCILLWFADGPIDVAARISKGAAIEAAHESLNFFIFIAIVLCVIGALGLYHGFLLRSRFSGSVWICATLAIWFEMGLSLWIGSMLLSLSESWLKTMPTDYSFWPTFVFALTLVLLALTRPLTLKWAKRLRTHIEFAS